MIFEDTSSDFSRHFGWSLLYRKTERIAFANSAY